MALEMTVRRWGNSLGIVLPKTVVEKEGLKENQKVMIEVMKKPPMKRLFNSLKRKVSGQEFKDVVREAWGT